jgi:hypothetical protein
MNCFVYCVFWVYEDHKEQNELLFVLLQQEADTVKMETDVDVLGEGDSVSMEPYKVYVPSAFAIEKFEPEVSYVFLHDSYGVCSLCVCMCGHVKRNYHTLFSCEYVLRQFPYTSLECLYLTVRSQLIPKFRRNVPFLSLI